ncbi:alpha/beta hydrolase family protein [Tenacibaculum dicentrarchi]|uniref:alpha/beta hydrolase family protein n=1 Tax=Tenacibaculum dicentrarchi TaxID=669041 RepID=UPI000C7E0C2B|nr:Carboxymethylenebutenolidase [Tenacibaculum dicentrarchi]
MKTVVLFLLLTIQLNAQCQKELNSYEHYQLKTETDTISYSVYSKNGINSVSKILLFIQGSGAFPFYEVEKITDGTVTNTTMPFDLEQIPEEYGFVLISKKGIPFCIRKEDKFETPDIFYITEGLDFRANRISKVIDHLTAKEILNPKKIVVIGHSEGSDVVAKLGTINKKITNIGYWSGGGNTQFYDFTLFIRKDVASGKMTEEQGIQRIDSVFKKLTEIMKSPESTTDFWQDNSYRRWLKFSEPPINNLLMINIPLFVAIGSKDQAVPVESTYLIPIEFIRHNKENLTFKVYPDLDHGFEKLLENSEYEDHWSDVFNDFMKWVETNKTE